MSIPRDTKDWTWVLDRRCPECSFDARSIDLALAPQVLRSNAGRWRAVLDRPDVLERPHPSTWSPLEYAAHVRDVFPTTQTRLGLLLTEDDPEFPDWDQDRAAIEGRYAELDPADVARELEDAASRLAEVIEAIPVSAADRSGRRSNGSRFTVETLVRYMLHDLVHHGHDVRA